MSKPGEDVKVHAGAAEGAGHAPEIKPPEPTASVDVDEATVESMRNASTNAGGGVGDG